MRPEDITIRDVRDGDATIVDVILRSASLANAADRAHLLAHPELLRVSPQALAEQRVRIADFQGVAAGFSETKPIGVDWEIEGLFVLPEHWRRGIGRNLVEDALARARVAGASTVYVTANLHALAFYESCAFQTGGDVSTQFGTAKRMSRSV